MKNAISAAKNMKHSLRALGTIGLSILLVISFAACSAPQPNAQFPSAAPANTPVIPTNTTGNLFYGVFLFFVFIVHGVICKSVCELSDSGKFFCSGGWHESYGMMESVVVGFL